MKVLSKPSIQTVFERLQAQNPHPTTELNYQNAFELLIAVMLSAQATDIGVNKVTQVLFSKANTPLAILELGLNEVTQCIQSLGLFRTKAKHVMQTCQKLLDDHQGDVPAQRAALEALPGVGRKTANVILNTAFGEPTMAVDTHIYRLARRLGLSTASTVLGVEKDLLKRIPQRFLKDAHHWLILHGRYVCKARKPNCSQCLLSDLCPSSQIS